MAHRLLFILKRRADGHYGDWCYGDNISSGLFNSVKFIVDMLIHSGVHARIAVVHDNNDIDREVTKFRPTDVIIEAFWVVPEKFDILKKLHPKVHWIVRDHSQTAFLSQEGAAFGWVLGYLNRGIEIAVNSPQAETDMRLIARAADLPWNLVTFLPNYCPTHHHEPLSGRPVKSVADIGCFGAIRPLKNQMAQAVAALEFVQRENLRLRFHINGNRVEGNGGPILKNLRQMFAGLKHAVLVEHPWCDHEQFLKIMRRMDISLQVSFSETFNIVSADAVVSGVPVVVSDQIPFLDRHSFANPNEIETISDQMSKIWNEWWPSLRLKWNLRLLRKYSKAARVIWLNRFN